MIHFSFVDSRESWQPLRLRSSKLSGAKKDLRERTGSTCAPLQLERSRRRTFGQARNHRPRVRCHRGRRERTWPMERVRGRLRVRPAPRLRLPGASHISGEPHDLATAEKNVRETPVREVFALLERRLYPLPSLGQMAVNDEEGEQRRDDTPDVIGLVQVERVCKSAADVGEVALNAFGRSSRIAAYELVRIGVDDVDPVLLGKADEPRDAVDVSCSVSAASRVRCWPYSELFRASSSAACLPCRSVPARGSCRSRTAASPDRRHIRTPPPRRCNRPRIRRTPSEDSARSRRGARTTTRSWLGASVGAGQRPERP